MRTICAIVTLGESADIQLNAYPDRDAAGRRSATSARFSIRLSARRRCGWRLRIRALMRLGMFVTATFHGQQSQTHAQRCRPPRSCICTIATGFTCPLDGQHVSAAWKCTGGKMLPGGHAGNHLRHQSPATVWLRTRCVAEHGGAVSDYHDSRPRRFRAEQPLSDPGGSDVLLLVWGAISFHNLPVEAYPDVANNYVRSSRSGPAAPPKKWSSRSRSRSKS